MGRGGPVLVLALVAGCASLPERELPDASASAEQVVQAFVAAVDDRDVAAVEAMASAEHADLVRDTWFGMDLRALDVGGSGPRSTAGSEAEGYGHAVYVPVDLMVSGGDISLDGRTAWGYLLARDGPDERWLVVDHGMG